ncbi:MAG: RDD family protein [Bacteroidota bacterium]
MRSITVRTNQNVNIDYELAPTMSRVAAFALDILFVMACYLILSLIFQGLLNIDRYDWESRMRYNTVIYGFLPLFIFLTYYFLAEMLSRGQTFGKRISGLRVIRTDGKEPTPGDFLMRTFLLLPDAFFSLGVPAMLLINSTPKAQRLGDMVANTAVIRTHNTSVFSLQDILRIQTTTSYEPRFPAVTHFSEEDMLLIKQSLARFRRFRNPAHQHALDRLAMIARERLAIDPKTEGPHLMSSENLLNTLLQDYIVLTR